MICVSRAGYDGSEDTDEPMTAEHVAEDYRRALENAGVQKPYLEKLGNCEIVYLPGEHFIYEQYPERCADIILDFIASLD